MKKLPLPDESWFRKEYVEKQRSSKDISVDFGCSETTILNRLKRYGIARRTISDTRKVKHWGGRRQPTTFEKLAEKISKRSVVNEHGCWIWTGAVFTNGYPCISVNGKSRKGNRVSYEVFNGPIPDGLIVCHSCDDKLCVNPKHLWLGTQQDNINDAVEKDRMRRGEAHHSNKLTEEQALAIKFDCRENKVIALQYGVSAALVGYIKKGVKWRRIG